MKILGSISMSVPATILSCWAVISTMLALSQRRLGGMRGGLGSSQAALQGRETKFTYRPRSFPGHIGSEFYLAIHSPKRSERKSWKAFSWRCSGPIPNSAVQRLATADGESRTCTQGKLGSTRDSPTVRDPSRALSSMMNTSGKTMGSPCFFLLFLRIRSTTPAKTI